MSQDTGPLAYLVWRLREARRYRVYDTEMVTIVMHALMADRIIEALTVAEPEG